MPAKASTAARIAEEAAAAPLCAVFRRHLRSVRLKYTPERAGVLDAIIERDGLFEVEELLNDLRDRRLRISKATVYRTLRLLQDAGIIMPAQIDARQSHYQLVYGRAPRDQMVCVRTGRVIEFTDPEIRTLRDRICRRAGWAPVTHRLQIFGVSPEDAGAEPPAS